MSCGEVTCKVISGIFTLIFTLVSIAIMAFSAFATFFIIMSTSHETLERYYVAVPPIVVFILSALLFIAVIFACCAMCQNSTCCLETYSIFLIILAIGNIAIGIYAIVAFPIKNQPLERQLRRDLENYMTKYTTYHDSMDFVQDWARCCGVDNHSEWDHLLNNPPQSCCRDNKIPCSKADVATANLYRDGCLENLSIYIFVLEYIIGIAAIVVGCSQIFATLGGFVLSCIYWRREYNNW